MRRSNLLWLAPVLISLVGPTACGGGDETVLIGEFGSMTGSEATFGHSGSTGTLAWADPRTETICIVLTTLPARAARRHPRTLVSDRVAEAVA